MLGRSRTARAGAKVSSDVRTDVIAVTENEVELLSNLARTAKARIRPFAEAPSFYAGMKLTPDMGDFDGTGLIVRLACVDMDGDGKVSGAEYARFLDESAELVAGTQSSVLNVSVVSALLLTILVPLMLTSVEYAEADGTVWGDTAAFLTADEGRAQTIRNAFLATEYAVLTVALLCSFLGLTLSLTQYVALVAMPGKVAAVAYMLEVPKVFTQLQTLQFAPVLLLICALPFIASRYSAVAFFCMAPMAVLWFALQTYLSMPLYQAQFHGLQRQARMGLGSTALEQAVRSE